MFTSCYIKSRNCSLFFTKKFSIFFVTNSENVRYLEKIETKKCVGNSFKTACLIVDSIFQAVFFYFNENLSFSFIETRDVLYKLILIYLIHILVSICFMSYNLISFFTL